MVRAPSRCDALADLHPLYSTTVKAPAEAILDSKILVAASGAGALKARQLKLDANAFDTVEFLNKLVLFMGGRLGAQGQKKGKGKRRADEDEDEDDGEDGAGLKWGRVGRVLSGESRRPATMDFMWVGGSCAFPFARRPGSTTGLARSTSRSRRRRRGKWPRGRRSTRASVYDQKRYAVFSYLYPRPLLTYLPTAHRRRRREEQERDGSNGQGGTYPRLTSSPIHSTLANLPKRSPTDRPNPRRKRHQRPPLPPLRGQPSLVRPNRRERLLPLFPSAREQDVHRDGG